MCKAYAGFLFGHLGEGPPAASYWCVSVHVCIEKSFEIFHPHLRHLFIDELFETLNISGSLEAYGLITQGVEELKGGVTRDPMFGAQRRLLGAVHL